MRRLIVVALSAVLAMGALHAQRASGRDVLFQTSTIGALLAGVYDGEITVGELRSHGDFGLGTVNCLDGELVVMDGRFFTIDAAGVVHELDDAVMTPFAAVTWFEADSSQRVEDVRGFAALQGLVDAMLPSFNICHAIRVTGRFAYVKTRSVPRQERPYPPLAEVVKDQPIFEFEDVRGTLVGFRLPAFVSGVNVPGYHLHFMTEGLDGGGHLLECRIAEALIEIDYTPAMMLSLPTTDDFLDCRLDREQEDQVQAVEREPAASH